MKKSTIVAGFVLLFALCVTREAQAVKPPNIVIILSDDQGWTDYSFMGHDAIQTPNLDKLAKQSVTFRNGHVPTALCRPSLTTLITGLYSHQTGITGNDPAGTPANLAHGIRTGLDVREMLISNIDKHPTLPRMLADQGYTSFQSGKWWEGSYQRGGFTHGMTRGFPEPGGRHGDDGLQIGREGMQPVFDFLDSATDSEDPFFLWYAPILPHTPHNPPQRILEKYQTEGRPQPIAAYYAMCDWFDETCGQLLDRLEEKGIADDTIVVYVTDNGWIQNPNGGGFLARSKRSPYEGGTRTPIMFRWPDKFSPVDRSELCSSIDIVPTLLAAAGADIPQNLPGLNLLPNLKEGTPIKRNMLFGETFAHDIADIEKPEASLLYRWVIRDQDKLLITYDGATGRMKYPPTSSQPQLYDLQADPSEKVNLALQHPEKVEELSKLLGQWYPLKERKQGLAPKE
ncbi:sulfatase family protein [Neorhodopirellula lusitana]|uniref:sulfatase family protein n=1 Tax=Neorhodopirellula lusitana TaxID=445327 RepID=UPI00384FF8C0